MDNNKIIVAFKIGRGGKFYNPGHKSYLGEKNFRNLIDMESNKLFIQNRDELGRFCKPYLHSDSGSAVSEDEVNALTGTLDFDGKYHTCYAVNIEECGEHEIELIANSQEHKSFELLEWLKSYDPSWEFDEFGVIKNETEFQ